MKDSSSRSRMIDLVVPFSALRIAALSRSADAISSSPETAMVVVSWSLLALIANTEDDSCDEAGILAPSLILSDAMAARKVEKMAEIPSNGPTTVPEHSSEITSIRLKQQMSRGSHEVARWKTQEIAGSASLARRVSERRRHSPHLLSFGAASRGTERTNRT